MPVISAMEKMIADLGLMVTAGARPGGDVQAGSLGKAIELVRSVHHGDWANRHISDYLQQVIDKEQKHDGVSARSEELPAVRVMNLHKVKGLEAPIVFLANAYGEGRHDVELFIDRSAGTVTGYMAVRGKKPEFGSGPLLAHPERWEELAEMEGSFVKAEELRLRYVAATRAGSAMVVTQRTLPKLNSRNAWRHFNPLLPDDSALEDPGPQKCPARESSTIDPAEATTSLARVDERLASAVTSTYDARPAKQYALGEAHTEEADRHAEEADSTSPGLEQATSVRPTGESGMEWGQAIHELLELAMCQPEADIVGWARTILVENELDPDHAEAAAEDVSSVMSSEIWRRSLASPRTLTEVPFEIMLDDVEPPTLVRGAIDLIFAEEDGWVLVDYKTDRITSSTTAEDLALAYAPQVRLYSKAWERATGDKVNEAGLYFVREGVFVPVRPDV
jgi:ATP-dependent helicase/nuclease subunit A